MTDKNDDGRVRCPTCRCFVYVNARGQILPHTHPNGLGNADEKTWFCPGTRKGVRA